MNDKRERIHIDMPVGTTGHLWARAMDCARLFATAYLDKPTGRRHGTEYVYDDGMAVAAWWTSTRAVSVLMVRGPRPTP